MKYAASAALAALLCLWSSSLLAADLLVEAESFTDHGGWKLDTQFIGEMGSPYLLAHGLGKPVAEAKTEVTFPTKGRYRVFVRTKDWVARWNAEGQPGKFQLAIDGKPLEETFGTKSADWFWHDGGVVDIENETVTLRLKDLTGFDGRCDAIYFTNDTTATPPSGGSQLAKWRKDQLGIVEDIKTEGPYDLVVIGGGYSGMGAALSAARMGCKVALIQDRPVLGGNGSSEVRVWAMGLIRRGKYPRIGEIIDEFADKAKKSPGTYEEFGDDKKEALVRAEPNIDLFLNHHANDLEMKDGEIASVTAFDTRTSQVRKFEGSFFCDATGHGSIGALAGALYDQTDKGRMGMSNMWRWDEADQPTTFPETPWALDLTMKDFPYPRDHHGQWFWESGFDKDPIGGAEAIRDWNLRAVYGAFNAMKNRDGASKHKNAELTWLAYVGGPRESRRLIGDVILTQEDIVAKREFPDGCVPSTWSIDLHYPKKEFADKFPENPFISIAVHDQRVDRAYGYPVPYRCFYSKNVPNLFMAGRCISVTHEALGTVRVMKTCGMMGEVVGKAVSICKLHDCSPREVYEEHWAEMDKLLQLPGQARRETVNAEIEMPKNIQPISPYGPPTGLDPNKMAGMVIDDRQAEKSGQWSEGSGLKGYVGHGYLYSGQKGATVRFPIKVKKAGNYEVRYAYLPHENRSAQVNVTLVIETSKESTIVNMKEQPPIEGGFVSLGTFTIKPGEDSYVEVVSSGNGNVHADAVQLIPMDGK
ncbi:FAD-dependent oxidoreductase [Bremerella sp. JC817]|uniref:FAD-dependent oxidoreductase n=1 Tax=Bremerella sp. JC817 TaxID=3231756 RepID=UPI00345763A7